jgi:hypothetical protein
VIRASGPAAKPVTAPVPAEPAPGRESSLLIFVLDANGLLSPLFTFKLPEEQISRLEEGISKVVEELPEVKTVVGRPPIKLIVTAINKQDPDYRGGEFALELGETLTIPELVSWFRSAPDDRSSSPHIRYYLNQRKPFEKYGYTVRALEDFKRDLNGPVKKDFYAVAEAHCAWAKANRVTPLE